MMTLATLLFGFMAVITLVGAGFEEVRARIRSDGTPSPLSGLTAGDGIMIALYFAAILPGFVSIIHLVLTD